MIHYLILATIRAQTGSMEINDSALRLQKSILVISLISNLFGLYLQSVMIIITHKNNVRIVNSNCMKLTGCR